MPTTKYRYEWVQAGGTLPLGNDSPTPLVLTAVPDHGIALKRIVARGWNVSGREAGLDHTAVENIYLAFEVRAGGNPFAPGPVRYLQYSSLPVVATGFFADAVDVYNAWYNGSGNELGFDTQVLEGSVFDEFPPYWQVQVAAVSDLHGSIPHVPLAWNGVVRALFAYPF